MTPRVRILIAGIAFLVVALFALIGLADAYWPFQSVVEVIAPFLVLSILGSVGGTLLLVALLLPRGALQTSSYAEQASAIDSLLSEMKRQP
jgi:hypothetical protein